MISEQTKTVLAATLPAVEGALPGIARNFYVRMFDAHPELLQDLFNRSNQQSADQPQVLAGSIALFAHLQLEPDAVRTSFLINRIAHKHASLGVTADQYAIVHKHLFEAIVEILGEAVTPEVAEAWDELYWEMANVLIGEEKQLYAGAGVAPGDVWRTVEVRERRQLSPDAVSYTLVAPEGQELPSFSPGQYISVQVPLDDGAHQIRQYSLTGPTESDEWRIGVKRDGEVSTFLHERVFEGDSLRVSLPFGDMVIPDDEAPLILASAGIGCTPVIGVLNHLVETSDSRPVQVLHADRSRSEQPHRGELADLVAALPEASLRQWYENGFDSGRTDAVRVGHMDLSDLQIDPAAHVMVCGPAGFLGAVRKDLQDLGVADERVHYETFGPELLRLGAAED